MSLNRTRIIIMVAALVLLVAFLVVGVLYLNSRKQMEAQSTDQPGDDVSSTDAPEKVPDGNPEANESSEGVELDPVTGEELTVVPDVDVETVVNDAEAQAKVVLDAIAAGDAQAVVNAYHPNYWTKEGMTIAEGVESTEYLFEELMLENVSYTIQSVTDAAEEQANTQRAFAESYGIASDSVTGVKEARIEFSYTIDGKSTSRLMTLYFIEIDGGWFLTNDLGQLFY